MTSLALQKTIENKILLFRGREVMLDKFLVSQNVIPSKRSLGGYLPYVGWEAKKPEQKALKNRK